MVIPSALILAPLLAGFVISAPVYYRTDPVQRIASLPFLMMAAPAVLLVAWLVIGAAGLAGPVLSGVAFAASIGTLTMELHQAHRLLFKAKTG